MTNITFQNLKTYLNIIIYIITLLAYTLSVINYIDNNNRLFKCQLSSLKLKCQYNINNSII